MSTSVSRSLGRAATTGAALVLALSLGGCVGNIFGGGGTEAQYANQSATQSEIAAGAESALPAIATECPPIKVREGAEALYAYANNKVGDARALNFQAVLDKQSRNCVVSNGLITVKMGVVGRVLLGPAGNENEVTVPLRFAVERDGQAVYSEKYQIPVPITPPQQSAEFVKVVENVAIPYIGGEDIVIWVGFDPKG